MYLKSIFFMLMMIIFGLALTKGLEFMKGYDLITKKSKEPLVNHYVIQPNETVIKPEIKSEEKAEYKLPKFEYNYKSADRWESLFNPHDIIKEWPMINSVPLDQMSIIIAFGNPKIDWKKNIGKDVDPDKLPIPEGEEFNALYCVFMTMLNSSSEPEFWLVGYSYTKNDKIYIYTIDEKKEIYKQSINENSEEMGERKSCYINT